MPAAVENADRYVDVFGRTAIEITNVTWGNGDTFVSEYAAVINAEFTPTTNASSGVTISGKTITLQSGGTLTGNLVVYADNH
jgi:hypothetical protein